MVVFFTYMTGFITRCFVTIVDSIPLVLVFTTHVDGAIVIAFITLVVVGGSVNIILKSKE